MKEIIESTNKINVYYNNKIYQIKNVKNLILNTLEDSYSSPSYIKANNDLLLKAKEKGLWIELIFHSLKNYNDFEFKSLLFQIKPKYDFITFYHRVEKYEGKCININLSKSTTELYNYIFENISEVL